MSLHTIPLIAQSKIFNLFRSWDAVQTLLDVVDETNPMFDMLLDDEMQICVDIINSAASNRLEEDMQIFVLATNEMINLEESYYQRLKSRMDRVLISSPVEADFMGSEMSAWNNLRAEVTEAERAAESFG